MYNIAMKYHVSLAVAQMYYFRHFLSINPNHPDKECLLSLTDAC